MEINLPNPIGLNEEDLSKPSTPTNPNPNKTKTKIYLTTTKITNHHFRV